MWQVTLKEFKWINRQNNVPIWSSSNGIYQNFNEKIDVLSPCRQQRYQLSLLAVYLNILLIRYIIGVFTSLFIFLFNFRNSFLMLFSTSCCRCSIVNYSQMFLCYLCKTLLQRRPKFRSVIPCTFAAIGVIQF